MSTARTKPAVPATRPRVSAKEVSVMNDDKDMQGPVPAAKPASRPPAGAPDTVGTRYLRRLMAGLGEPLPLVLAEPADPDREAGG